MSVRLLSLLAFAQSGTTTRHALLLNYHAAAHNFLQNDVLNSHDLYKVYRAG
jgi:hypothetical protein